MMTLEKEYDITAIVLVPMKVHYRIKAATSEEDAEQKFTNLVNEGFEFVYQYDNNSFQAYEVLEFADTFQVETNQER